MVLIAGLILLSMTPAADGNARPGEPIAEVVTRSGAVFTGAVDSRSSENQLWLRTSRGGAHLQRAIAWNHVVEVRINGRTIAGDDVKSQIQRWSTPLPAHQWSRPPVSAMSTNTATPSLANSSGALRPASHLPIAFVDCDVRPFNTDADAAFEGLRLYCTARDTNRNRIPVRGTLQVTCTGVGYGDRFAHATGTGRALVRLGYWSRYVNSDRDAIVLPLPQGIPLNANAIGPYATLHIRLLVPGEGVFEQRLDGVRIQPYTFLPEIHRF